MEQGCENLFERLNQNVTETDTNLPITEYSHTTSAGIMKKMLLSNRNVRLLTQVNVPHAKITESINGLQNHGLNNGIVNHVVPDHLQNGSSPTDHVSNDSTPITTVIPEMTEQAKKSSTIKIMEHQEENSGDRNLFKTLESFAEPISNIAHQQPVVPNNDKMAEVEQDKIIECKSEETEEPNMGFNPSTNHDLPDSTIDTLTTNKVIIHSVQHVDANNALIKTENQPIDVFQNISHLSSTPSTGLFDKVQELDTQPVKPEGETSSRSTLMVRVPLSLCNDKDVPLQAKTAVTRQNSNDSDSNSANLRRSNRIKSKVGRSDSFDKDKEEVFSNDETHASVPDEYPNCTTGSQQMYVIDSKSGELPEFKHIYENQWYSSRKKSKSRKYTRHMACECTTTREERRSGIKACGENCLNRLLMIECSSRCPCSDYCTNKRFQRRIYAKVGVFKTENKGWGLRAMHTIHPGDLIMEYCGEIIDPKEFLLRSTKYSAENQQHFYFMALSQDEIIDATKRGNVSRFINHSCDPNAETQKWTVNGKLRVGFFAICVIEEGVEITFDYQFERYGQEAQKCYCGSSKCRGYLGKAPNEQTKQNNLWNRTFTEISPEKGETIEFVEPTFDDNTLAVEISRFSVGLNSTKDALSLCRLMVRCDTQDERTMCLNVLKSTQMQTYLKYFMQYHGLSLIWSWMVDLPATSDLDIKLDIVRTLELLPIATKNALDDSNILPVINRWIEDTRKAISSEPIESNQAPDSNQPTNAETNLSSEIDQSQMQENGANEESETIDNSNSELLSKMEKLVESWKDLREIYRIPKRQKNWSVASSPTTNSQHESSPSSSENSKRSRTKDHSSNHKSSSSDSRRHEKDRDRHSDKRHHHHRRSNSPSSHHRSHRHRRRSPYSDKRRKRSNSGGSSPTYNTADDWINEQSSSRNSGGGHTSREEHRKQFERDMKLKEQIPTVLDRGLHQPNNDSGSYIQIPGPGDQNVLPQAGYTNLVPINPQPQLASAIHSLGGSMQQQVVMQGGTQFITAQPFQTAYTVQPIYAQQSLLPIPSSTPQIPQQPPTTTAPNPGVTILGSQGNQTIVLLTPEQLQQLTQVRQGNTVTTPATTEVQQVAPVPPVEATPPKEEKLPPNWKSAEDPEGKTYYYHAITRQTQWDRPTSSGNAIETIGSNESEEMEISTPTHDERQSKVKNAQLSGEAKKIAEREKLAKDQFRLHLSKFVVKCLGHYRKPECKKGRVTSSEDFKHIARKLTHNLMEKEMKLVKNYEDLEFNSNVKHKTKEYIHKYMGKVGTVYRIKDDKS